MKSIIYLLLAIAITSCSNQKELPILSTTSKNISIKDGDKFHQDTWEIAPQLEVDEFIPKKFIGTKKISFISDIDTLTFNVIPNNIYDFVIQYKEEKAFTRINTDTLKEATLTPRKVLNYYYKDAKKLSLMDTIPFRIGVHNRIHITGSINGSVPLDFEFDTGANGIVIASSIIGEKVNLILDGETLNAGSDGISEISTSSNNTIEINGLVWDDIKLLSIQYEKSTNDGILGWVAFEGKLIEIDYEKKILVIHQSINTIPKGYSKIETKMIGDIPYIKGTITVGNKTSSGWFEYDSGYNGSFSLSQKFASENNLNNVMEVTGTSISSGSAGIKLKSNNYILPKLTLGKFEITNIPIAIDEKDAEGVDNNDILGNNLLKRFNAIIDLQKFEIYLKPNTLLNSEY